MVIYMDKILQLEILFQTLGDANRLRIIHFIGNISRSVSEIVEATKLSQPLVSHHLKALRNKNILETKRDGPFIFYKVKDSRLLDVLGLFSEILNSTEIPMDKENLFSCASWMKDFWKK